MHQLCYMRVPPLVCLCFFPGVFLSSTVTGACSVATDLIMRVNVRKQQQCAWFSDRRQIRSFPSNRIE